MLTLACPTYTDALRVVPAVQATAPVGSPCNPPHGLPVDGRDNSLHAYRIIDRRTLRRVGVGESSWRTHA